MHTFGENSSSGVPAFLAKLWRLVEDEDTNNLIYWNADGTSFIIQNQAQFAREILPLNYKHNNMASFIRQLNMYGFHKITSLDGGGLKFDRDEMEFSHPCFRRDQAFLLEHIKRKISTAKTTNPDDKSTIKHEVVSKVLSDVKVMKGRQDSLDNRFVSMKQENEALWREVAILRQKHLKQQQIVNKLIQFLVTIVQPQRGSGIGSMNSMSGVKRRYQLMINDVPDASKVRKTDRTKSTSSVNNGPIIRELTEELLDNYNDAEDEIDASYVVSPGFQQQSAGSEYDDIENITDVEQMEDEDADETTYQMPMDDCIDPKYENYTTESIDAIAQVINEEAGPSNTTNKTSYIINGIGEEIPAEMVIDASHLLETQRVQSTPQPSVMRQSAPSTQYQQTAPAVATPKQAGASRKMFVPADFVRSVQMPVRAKCTGMKRTPAVVQMKPNQPMATTTATTNLLRGPMGKSLLDLQKLKMTATKKQLPNIVQQPQQQRLIVHTSSAVGTTNEASPETAAQKSQVPLPTPVAAGKSCTNKSDFINAEIPQDLFDDNEPMVDSLLPVDLRADDVSTIVDVDEIGNSFSPSQTMVESNNLAGGSSTSTSAAASGNGGKNMAIAKYNNEDIMTISSPDQIHHHLDTVQGDLESLKEFLRNEDYSLDANALLGNPTGPTNRNCLYLSPSIDGDTFSTALSKLFNDTDVFQQYGIPMNPNDSTMPATMPEIADKSENPTENEVSGSELISYQPTALPIDFTEFLNMDDEEQHMMTINDQNSIASSGPMENELEVNTPSADLSTPFIKRERFDFPK